MTPAPIRVLMVDDHPVVLAGLKALVGADPDFVIVGEARDGRTALRMAIQLVPDVVVLDISLPEMNGIELAAALRTERPECRVLVLTVHEERAYLRRSSSWASVVTCSSAQPRMSCRGPSMPWPPAVCTWTPPLPGRWSAGSHRGQRNRTPARGPI